MHPKYNMKSPDTFYSTTLPREDDVTAEEAEEWPTVHYIGWYTGLEEPAEGG